MSIAVQIGVGSALILVCAAIHIAVVMSAIAWLRSRQPLREPPTFSGGFRTVGLLFVLLLLSHTAQVYIWALVLWWSGALQGFEAPVYFALVTYTTLGYGDVTLTDAFRILGAMASVCGILMFGLTTAFLVGALSRLLRAKA